MGSIPKTWRTRKEVAKEKAYLRGTGGGSGVKKELDPIVEATLNIINIKTVVGFSNMFDSDASTSVFIPENIPSPGKLEEQISDLELLYIETVEDTDEYSSVAMQSPTLLEFNKENVKIINLPSTPKNYETATPNNYETASTLKGKKKRENPSVKIQANKKLDWSRYVPNNLKSKPHDKLRPTVKNPVHTANEMYYKTKVDLLQRTFDSEEDRIRRREKEKKRSMKKNIIRFSH